MSDQSAKLTTLFQGRLNGPDSSSGSEAGGRRFETWPHHTKGVKIVPVATLLGAQHYQTITDFSSLIHY